MSPPLAWLSRPGARRNYRECIMHFTRLLISFSLSLSLRFLDARTHRFSPSHPSWLIFFPSFLFHIVSFFLPHHFVSSFFFPLLFSFSTRKVFRISWKLNFSSIQGNRYCYSYIFFKEMSPFSCSLFFFVLIDLISTYIFPS